jgi:predicted RNase H-like nuclease (RuvC/YqgF family)
VLLDDDEPTYKELVNIHNKSNDTIKELNSIINSYHENNYEFRSLCKLVKKLYDDDIECRCKIKEQAVEIKALKEKLKTWKCKKGVM